MRRGPRPHREQRYHAHALEPGHRLPPVITAKIVRRDHDGDLLAAPLEWKTETMGEMPRIVILSSPGKRSGPAPGIGDVVLIRVQRSGRQADAYIARVLKRIGRAEERRIGLLRDQGKQRADIIAVEKRAAGRSWQVRSADLNGAVDGDLVAFTATTPPRAARPMARVDDILGRADGPQAMSTIAIAQHGIPFHFSAEALAQAKSATPAKVKREDWRDLPLITIDPADARDHDDAVHARPDPDSANPGGFILTIAIADVCAYVPCRSELDLEARERGNSVYFPDRVVPMLPERLSNDLCSLKQGEERAALAIRIVIDGEGRKLRHSLHRILMRSAAKLSYQQAQAAIDGDDKAAATAIVETVLKPLWQAYHCLKTARDKRAPLALDLAERKLVLKADGSLERAVTPPRLDAHRLIEDFMIEANVAAAELLEEKRSRPIYRVHDQPSLDRLNALRDFLSTLDIPLAKGGVLKPALFNKVLALVRGTPDEALVNEAVLRSQAQAEYSTRNLGHFGLNLARYAHFTSPIRRYADLIVHRSLIRAYGLGPDGIDAETESELDDIAAQTSLTERRATIAERETTDRIIAASLESEVGAVFTARISGMTRSGLFVSLLENGADGFVPMAGLGRGHFQLNEKHRLMSGGRRGPVWRQGDVVEVRLVEAQAVAGALRFEMLPKRGGEPTSVAHAKAASEPAAGKRAKRRRAIEGEDIHAVDE